MSRTTAWWVLALTGIALFGNYYVYDSIGPVAEMLSSQRGLTDTQIGTLNAIYSAPNLVLVLVGGILIDRFGPGLVAFWTAVICAFGAVLTAIGEPFAMMALGRLLFGVGAETMIVAGTVVLGLWFGSRQLAFAMALSVSFARLGSYAVDVSPIWAPRAYASGWQAPLWIAAVIMAVGVVASWIYWRVERRAAAGGMQVLQRSGERFVWRDLARFGGAYWLLLAVCVLFYSVIFPFRSTFAIKYLQHTQSLTLEQASVLNSYVFLAAVFVTPVFGFLIDRVGRHAWLLVGGSMTLLLAFALGVQGNVSPGVTTALIGVSFALVPAVIWPATALLVPAARLGTAFGLMTMLQNFGMLAGNLVAGGLNDRFGASAANPAGYLPMMWFFTVLAVGSLVFSLILALRRRT